MLTLNSKALKIGNKWLNPINGSGPVPESESYLLRVWTSHDRQITFQKLVLNDVDPTTVDYSVLPSGKRPTDSPIDYCPPLVNNITLRFAYNNDSYNLNSQIQEFVNGGNVNTYPDYTSYLQDNRYDAYVDLEFEWPYSFPIQSSGSLTCWNGGRAMLYKIVNDTHYAEIASYDFESSHGAKTFSIDQTVYDVNADSSLSLWPSAGASGDVLQIDWTPPSNQSLSSFSVNGGTVSNSQLTMGNSDVTLQANYGTYNEYTTLRLELTPATYSDGSVSLYLSNMNVTPNSGTYTNNYGTYTLSATDRNNIAGTGPYIGSGVSKVNLAFYDQDIPYISWDSYLANNNNYPCIGGTITAKLYGSSNNIEYPLGSVSYSPNNVMYTYKISTCVDSNIPVYTLTKLATNGTLSSSKNGGIAGTQITLTATPNSGYTFDSYTVTGTGASISGNTLTIGTSDVTVTANFVQGSAGYEHYMLSVQYTSDTNNNGALFLRNGLVNGSTSPNALSGTGINSYGTTETLSYLAIGSTSWNNYELGGSNYCNKVTFELDMSSDPSSMSFMLYDVGSHTCSARFYGIDSLGTEHTIHEWTGLVDRDTFTYTA